MARFRTIMILVAAVLLGAAVPAATAGPARKSPRLVPVSVDLTWLAVSPVQPRHLYIGLGLLGDVPSDKVVASSDGGATFDYLQMPGDCPTGLLDRPLTFGPEGRHVYTECGDNLRDASTMASGDGLHWSTVAYDALAISPLNPRRWYDAQSDWQSIDQGGGCFSTVRVSDDSGTRWHDAGALPQVAPLANDTGADGDQAGDYVVANLVADPAHADTVYANYVTCPLDNEEDTALVARSQDGGATWTLLPVPRGLHTFTVGTDPHEPGLLVGTTSDKGVPADRIYLSGDQGQTWRIATCPGDLHGACPIAVVDTVFGAGRSYAFFKSGIYAFKGNGPAGDRLAISDRLPVPAASIVDAQAGSRPGDPVYLLSNKANGTVRGRLYRSDDGGATWHLLSAGVLPTVAAASTAPGALPVAATHHSVAAPFVTTYRHLTPALVGFPITEAYVLDGVLTQDFQRMRLELRAGKVMVGDDGREIFDVDVARSGGDQPSYDFLSHLPWPATPSRSFTPSGAFGKPVETNLSGPFLAFWQKHGGMAVLGAPLTNVYKDPNGDGSGRSYVMQLFEKARLELHPELHNTVLLGLIGYQCLVDRGWLYDRSADA